MFLLDLEKFGLVLIFKGSLGLGYVRLLEIVVIVNLLLPNQECSVCCQSSLLFICPLTATYTRKIDLPGLCEYLLRPIACHVCSIRCQWVFTFGQTVYVFRKLIMFTNLDLRIC